jgi:KDO2-lipid IV(A) lauroyltransferase
VAEFKLIEKNPKQTKDYELTDAYFKLLEASINRAPQYWLWTHNRWKRSHEEFNIRYDAETGRVSLEPLEDIKRRRGLI